MKPELKIAYCPFEAAKFAVMKWHYSKRMPRFKQSYLGVWEGGRFIGAVIFGRSTTPAIGDAYHLKNTECVELTRIALTSHLSPVSRIVAICLKIIKRSNPDLKLIVSYADANVGHHGGIYQAGNWIYVGGSSRKKQYFFRGKWRNDSSLWRLFKKYPDLNKKCKTRTLMSKHKYLYALDEDVRMRIAPLMKKYPSKRAKSIASDAPGFHLGEGGAAPTFALKLKTEAKSPKKK